MSLHSSGNSSTYEQNGISPSPQLSLNDMIDLIITSYKKILIASAIGALLGYAAWFFLFQYRAEVTLINATNGLDLVSWRILQKGLPNLADQIVQDNKAPESEVTVYRQMSDPEWWKSNVEATYALSKADTKDLAGISKDLDGAGSSILSLMITAPGHSRKASIENADVASRFLLTGGAYLQLRSMLNGYEAEALSAKADVEKRIGSTEIELAYLQGRAKNLDDLLKRFPSDQKITQQVTDPKDSGAKYLPISTQIIAINTEIYQNREVLARLTDRLTQLEIMNQFLQEATPKAQTQFDGIGLIKQYLLIEDTLRKALSPDDLKARAALDQLRSKLLKLEDRFTKGLEANTSPIAYKRGAIKVTLGGMALAFLVTLLFFARAVLVLRVDGRWKSFLPL